MDLADGFGQSVYTVAVMERAWGAVGKENARPRSANDGAAAVLDKDMVENAVVAPVPSCPWYEC